MTVRTRWHYKSNFLGNRDLLAVAHLLTTDDWRIRIDGWPHSVRISIIRKDTE
ncbi:hypothetical protein [Microbacterium sp. SORGH_AS_0888]|uniref:hypothetical protein n=1 Tax=Microbacterium sp. SORGH_AS_0888 TaxID=3041791 RepID=UPI0027832F52|nr:hypothetical protein [Microbacterium sp. SORGH_AS_0888]MDQ1130674.1 hypothetical protein [Microbacterium sp. SORGH_AS_0888]